LEEWQEMTAACHHQIEDGILLTGGESPKFKSQSSREAQIAKLKNDIASADGSFGSLNFELPLSFEL
jgi:hypothetical protein